MVMHIIGLLPSRGVRQGCPLSGLLFVVGIELLARVLKKDPTIKGIKVGQKEIKITQYADDTTVLVRDLDSVIELLKHLDKFKQISGLEINTNKTEALWLGCWSSSRLVFNGPKNQSMPLVYTFPIT